MILINLFVNSTVQHECIPQAVLGMDILGQAKSGMGKTAVFVLATLQQIDAVDGQVSYSQHSTVIYFPYLSSILWLPPQSGDHIPFTFPGPPNIA